MIGIYPTLADCLLESKQIADLNPHANCPPLDDEIQFWTTDPSSSSSDGAINH